MYENQSVFMSSIEASIYHAASKCTVLNVTGGSIRQSK